MTQTPFVRIVTGVSRPFGGTRRFAMQAGAICALVAIGCWIAWPRSPTLPAALLWPVPIMLGVLIAHAARTRSWEALPPDHTQRIHVVIATMTGGMAGGFAVLAIAGTAAPITCAVLLCLAESLALAATTIDDGRG